MKCLLSILLNAKGIENAKDGNKEREKEMEIVVITLHPLQLAVMVLRHIVTIITILILIPNNILILITPIITMSYINTHIPIMDIVFNLHPVIPPGLVEVYLLVKDHHQVRVLVQHFLKDNYKDNSLHDLSLFMLNLVQE